jgi:parvulin-like peptidyl-prolyl isomerase
MLAWMRKWAPVIMIVALVGFMLTIFIDWGMGLNNLPGRNGRTVGKIGDKTVDIREFSQMLEIERQNRTQQGQSKDDDGTLPMQVWEAYVSEALTNKAVKELGLSATVEEVYSYLRDNPPPAFTQSEYFQTNGQFDRNKFIAFINTPSSYDNPAVQQIERYIRDIIVPANKLNVLIESGNNPSFSEIEYEYKQQNERVSFEYISVNQHSIDLSPQDLSDEKIKVYYDAHISDYKTAEKATVYFARFPKSTTQRDEELIANELRDIKSNILAGNASFDEEARVNSDDLGSARIGGELGWFKRGQMVKEFEDAAFSTSAGEISEPFKSAYGFHIIAVDSIKTDADTVVEVKAKHILKYITAGAETLDSIEALAAKVRSFAEDKNMLAAAKEFLIEVDSTLPFGKGENPSGIGYIANLGHFVFDEDAKSGDVSEILETESAFFVMELKEKIAKGNLPFEYVKAKIRGIVEDSLRIINAKNYLIEITGKINETPFEEFAQDNDKLRAAKVDLVTRKQFVPGIGYNNEALAAAFVLPENKISKPIVSDNGVYIIRTTAKELVRGISKDMPEFATIANKIKSESARSAYQDWFNANKKQLKVSENVRDFYY